MRHDWENTKGEFQVFAMCFVAIIAIIIIIAL
jgi:hypothetical protein